jgi:hypothetical protein
MPKKKRRTLNELFYDLAPYLRAITPNDESDDFLPMVKVMYPNSWRIPTETKYEVSHVASATSKTFTYKLLAKEDELDELVVHIEDNIKWNMDYEEKIKMLEQAKQDLLEKQQRELEDLTKKILPDLPEGVVNTPQVEAPVETPPEEKVDPVYVRTPSEDDDSIIEVVQPQLNRDTVSSYDEDMERMMRDLNHRYK